MEFIPLARCLSGRVYRLHSRNLALGVFDGRTGFIGVRTKFEARFLFREYHGETGPPHGTAWPLAALDQLPEAIALAEHEPTIDERSGRPVAFDRPLTNGGRGWFFCDSGLADERIRPVARTNQALLDYLDLLKMS